MTGVMAGLGVLAFGLVMGTNVLNARRFGRWEWWKA